MSETRRKFSREFKVEAVRLVTEGGQTIAETARELGFVAFRTTRYREPERQSARRGRVSISSAIPRINAHT